MTAPRATIAVLLALGLAVSLVGGAALAQAASDSAPERIGVRQIEGVGEFYGTASGERFVPRGVNYIDFVRDEFGNYRDAVFATDSFDAERVRTAFQDLADRGYNTARIFFDTCGVGHACIGIPGGQGLQPQYLDNMTTVMHIAADAGIYLLLTANSIPDDGAYWEFFDELFGQTHPGFTRRENADYLHSAGVETKARFWDDLLAGLAAREAPFEAVLGWQLTNEQWLFREHPPMSLEAGFAETANGKTYDLAKPREKRAMVADGIVYLIDRLRGVIAAHDPEGLVTMGWFAPYFQPEWYVDTAPMLARAELDFFDFHAYADAGLTPAQQARSFGMRGYDEKPILMGETGVGKAILPTATSAVSALQRWIADSCAVGFDGWLNWGYYPWPEDLDGAAWAFLDDGGRMLETLAPISQPDACVVPVGAGSDVARSARVSATRTNPGQPPRNAIDGKATGWSAGDFAPQSLRLKLRQPATIAELGLAIDQWPPGMVHHRIWATLRGGRRVLLADVERYLHPESSILFSYAPGIPAVSSLQLETVKSPSWVSWREVSAIDEGAASRHTEACLVGPGAVRQSPSADAPVSTRLRGGDRVVAEARLASDPAWLRVPGDHWTRASRGACASLPAVDGPRVDLVPVSFELRVPGGSGEVYLAGDLGAEADLPLWNPATVFFGPDDRRLRRVSLPLPRGSEIRYKYTSRGSWDGREMDGGCEEAPDRELTVEWGLVVRDTVARWAHDC